MCVFIISKNQIEGLFHFHQLLEEVKFMYWYICEGIKEHNIFTRKTRKLESISHGLLDTVFEK